MIHAAILRNEVDHDHDPWLTACDARSKEIKYDVINLSKGDWMEQVLAKDYDIYLTQAPCTTSYFKQMYDERVYILNTSLKKRIYPTLDEILIYENKRFISYWLEANKIPHPKTRIYYDKQEALEYIRTTKYPFVAKTTIGATGSGVKIIKTESEAKDYVKRAFSSKGIGRRWWPNTTKKDWIPRIKAKMKNFSASVKHYQTQRKQITGDAQKNFVLFQEYVNIKEEWRCVYIGGDYFGHKKERKGEFFSGGGGIVWHWPDETLLNLMKQIVDAGKFEATSFDILELEDGRYIANEIQAFFGYLHPEVQMFVDDVPGKYIYEKGKWKFVEGIYNRNNSYDLRVDHIIREFNKK